MDDEDIQLLNNKNKDNITRESTDKWWVIIFIIITLFVIKLSKTIVYDNDNIMIEQVYDSRGNGCGLGEFKDFKYLYFISFEYPLKSVCVDKCPIIDYNQVKYNSTGNYTAKLKHLYYNDFYKILLKNEDDNIKISTTEDFVYEDKWEVYFSYKNWEDYLSNFKINCKTNDDVKSCNYTKNNFVIYDTRLEYSPICMPITDKVRDSMGVISQTFNFTLIFGIFYNYKLYTFTVIVSVFLGFIWLLVIKYFTTIIIYSIIIIPAFGIFFYGFLLQITLNIKTKFVDIIKREYIPYGRFVQRNPAFTFIISLALIIFGITLIIYICIKRNKIKLALNLVQISSKIMLKRFGNIIIGLIILSLKLVLFIIFGYCLFKIYAYNSLLNTQTINYQDGYPFPLIDVSFIKIIYFIIYFYYFVVLLNILDTVNDYNGVSAAINVFYNYKISAVMNFIRNIFYNIGSILLYSIIWVFVTITQVMYMIFSLGCYNRNKFLMNISEIALVFTYKNNQNFINSCWKLKYLKKSRGSEYQGTFIISFTIRLFSKIIISLACSKLTIILLLRYNKIINNTFDKDYIAITSFIISYFVISITINLFNTTIETLIILFMLEEEEEYNECNKEKVEKNVFIELRISEKHNNLYNKLQNFDG